jgi:hypothetical protein
MADNLFQGEIDPELAALLGANSNAQPAEEKVPDFSDLFNEGASEPKAAPEEVSISREGFPKITKQLEETGHNALEDPNYYKTALAGEGDIAQRVHAIFQKFLNTKDPKDRGVFRQQLITAFWDFYKDVAKKAPGKIPDPKKYLLRFGLLHPTLLDKDTRTLFSRIVDENTVNQPIYYMDEWFKAVGIGTVRASTTDEAKVSRSNNAVQLQALMDKAKGKLDGTKVLIKTKNDERSSAERSLRSDIAHITEHGPVQGLPDISSPYAEGQKRTISNIQEITKVLLKTDRELDGFIREYYQAEQDVRGLQRKIEEEGAAATVDTGAIDAEFNTIRQMVKMTVGRQGNHFPILIGEYYHCLPTDLGYRENVINTMAWVESIDPEAYCRVYKNMVNRIVPYVILIPSYGDFGMCWEPFDKFNRATSRGRIAVPMYSKSLQLAVLTAVGDFRWQVAKEKASFYWMEEGITGNYYQWFQKMKLKGDVKGYFIRDYILWITKESEGTQKLDKELRGVFWRHLPFSQPVKEKLKTRSFTYQELYQRDINRTMSDGY